MQPHHSVKLMKPSGETCTLDSIVRLLWSQGQNTLYIIINAHTWPHVPGTIHFQKINLALRISSSSKALQHAGALKKQSQWVVGLS